MIQSKKNGSDEPPVEPGRRPLLLRLGRSALAQAVKVALGLVLASLAVLLSPFPGLRSVALFSRFWSWAIMRLAGARLEVSGLEHVSTEEPQIIVSNHQGDFDIYAYLYLLSHINFRFIVKKELFRIPVFGWALWLTGFPKIDRGNSVRARRAMVKTARRMKRTRMSILAFPEGTRNTRKGLLPFKKGAFVIAVRLGLPVVPAVINGSRRIQKRRSFFMDPGPLSVEFLEPIPTRGLTYEDRDRLMEGIRESILARLDPRDR